MRTSAAASLLVLGVGVAVLVATAPNQAGDLDDLITLRPESLPAVTPAVTFLAAAEAAVAEHPTSSDRFHRLGALQARNARETGAEDDFALAEESFRTAVALRGDYAAARVALARMLSSQHLFTEAVEALDELSDEHVTAPAALAARFDAEFGRGRYARAAAALADIEGRSAPAVLARQAALAELHGEDERAFDLFVAAARAARDEYQSREEVAWYLYRIGEFLLQRGNLDPAGEFVAAALRLDPGSLAALTARAHLALAGDSLATAVAYWEDLCARLPHPENLVQLGDLYAAQGRESDSELAWARGLAAGEAAGAAEDRPMARLLADHGWRAEEALMRARRDLEHRQDVEAWDTLAWAAYRAGEFEEAWNASRRALQHGTRRADFHDHAARIAEALGQPDLAGDHDRQVQEINPAY